MPDAPTAWQRLARSESLESYGAAWLELLCAGAAGWRAGLLVLRDAKEGALGVGARWPADAAFGPEVEELAQATVDPPQGLAVSLPDGGQALSHPVLVDQVLWAVVVAQLDSSGDELEAMRRLQWGALALEAGIRKHAARGTDGGRQEELLDLVAAAQEEPRYGAATRAVVSHLAQWLQCDRVSLGVARGDRVRVVALSHSGQFGREMNLVRDIEAAVHETLDEGREIALPAAKPAADAATQSTPPAPAHRRLAAQHGSGAVLSVPLEAGVGVRAVLVLERSLRRPFDDAEVAFCGTALALVGPLLEAKRRGERPLAMAAGHALRSQCAKLFGRGHAARKLAAGVLGALLLFALLAEGDYRVSSDARLQGAVRRALVVPFDAYIASAVKRAGDIVEQGEILATLDDRELRLERLQWTSQRLQVQRQYDDALAQRDRAAVNIFAAQIAQADAEIALLDERLSRTAITAPLSGIVVSGDLSQSLGSSVRRGELLYELAPLDEYRVILEVDESQIRDVAEGAEGTLLLTSLPDERLPFEVTKITPVSTPGEGRNTFRVEAALGVTSPRLRPGMEGVGKIAAGERRLSWIWTREFATWLRLKLWAWAP